MPALRHPIHFVWSCLSALATALALSSPASGAAGDPHPSFGTDGIFVAADNQPRYAIDAALQDDGNLLVGARGENSSTFDLYRLTTNGVLDAVFGEAGIARVEVGGIARLEQVLLLPDGRSIMAGTRGSGSSSRWILTGQSSVGALDPSFGDDGMVVAGPPPGGGDLGAIVTDSMLDSSGRIVLVGYSFAAGTGAADVLVGRFLSDGTPDPSFGDDGMVAIDLGGREWAYGLAVDTSNRIVLAGGHGEAAAPELMLLRLLADGSIDGTFGVGGIAGLAWPGPNQANDVILLADQRLIVSATVSTGEYYVGKLLRLDANGQLDVSYGIAGLADAPGVVFDLATAPGGRIAVATSGFLWGHWGAIGAARLSSDGEVDPDFGWGGRAAVHPGPSHGWSGGLAVAADPDGDLLVAGFSEIGPWNDRDRRVAVARFDGNSPDCSTDAQCDLCERCGDAGVCVIGARTSCTRPDAKGARWKLIGAPDERPEFQWHPRLSWRWRGGADLGGLNPQSGDDLALCAFWDELPILDLRLPGNSSWQQRGGAYVYRDQRGRQDGFDYVKLGEHDLIVTAQGQPIVRARYGFADPLLAPARDDAVLHIQLQGEGGSCFAASYPKEQLRGTYLGHQRFGIGW